MRYPITQYFDQFELIGNYDPPGHQDELNRTIGPQGWIDGGDTAQRMGMYHIGLWAREIEGWDNSTYPYRHLADFYSVLEMLTCYNKWFRRHPDPAFWYSDDDRGSRDQSYPMLAAIGALNCKIELKETFISHLKRLLLFTTNTRDNGTTEENHGVASKDAKPLKWYHKLILKYKIPCLPTPDGHRNYNWKLPDITFLSFWALYVRGLNPKSKIGKFVASLVLNVLDLEFLVNAILKRTLVKKDNDIVNHVVEAVYAHYRIPSLVSKFTNAKVNSAEDMIKKLRAYFHADSEMHRDPYFIGIMYEDLLRKVMGK